MSILTFARIGIRLAVGVVLVLHGLAHAPGVLASWGLASYENVSYQPNILLETASDGVVRLLGAVWLVAGAAFVLAGIGILRQAPWWRPTTLVACLLSLTVSTLWLEDAIVGLVINLGLLVLCWGSVVTASTFFAMMVDAALIAGRSGAQRRSEPRTHDDVQSGPNHGLDRRQEVGDVNA